MPSRRAARSASSSARPRSTTTQAALLSHEIAREIEDQLEYPGQVKVTVIRESRSIDVARNHAAVQNGGGGSLEAILGDDVPAPEQEHPPIQAA